VKPNIGWYLQKVVIEHSQKTLPEHNAIRRCPGDITELMLTGCETRYGLMVEGLNWSKKDDINKSVCVCVCVRSKCQEHDKLFFEQIDLTEPLKV